MEEEKEDEEEEPVKPIAKHKKSKKHPSTTAKPTAHKDRTEQQKEKPVKKE